LNEQPNDHRRSAEITNDLLFRIKPAFKVWLEVETPSGSKVILGGGKAELLRSIVKHGSINAAAEALGLGFRTAWKLLQEIDQTIRCLGDEFAIIESQRGGKDGGGTSVTTLGVALVRFLEDIEDKISLQIENKFLTKH